LAGWPCDMDPILELAKERSLFVVEDCAQAHGATYKGRPVGSFGDAAAFSFFRTKF
jgi:dTDP-4-amino-4,6-dideoxygalactose transaminase